MKQIIEKHPVVACFLVTLLAYLPIASFLFAVKNDFFTAYFPLKFFLSESLDAGSFPLWNPYLNYGFPTYGDMSLGYWNPATWLIAAMLGYNPYTFTLELLAYLLAAVWGMYRLSGIWLTDTRTRQLATVAYACSGFIVGHLQHFNWITGAAMVPACLYFLISYQRSGALKDLIAAVLTCFWLLSSAHPGITIGFIIFCIPLLIHLQLLHPKQLARLAILIIATLLLSAGMIFGYSEVLHFTNRSGPVGDSVIVENTTTTISWISFLFSMPITKNDAMFRSDISMRNCFIGILLLASLVATLLKNRKGSARFFLVTGACFLILSSELVLPFYKYLPLVNFVRLNSEFRLFALLSFIITGSIALQDALHQQKKLLQIVLGAISLLLGISILAAIVYGLFAGQLSLLHSAQQTGNARAIIKGLVAGLTMPDTIIIHGSIQLVITLLMIRFLKAGNTNKVFQIAFFELILATLLQLPFTGVGQLSPAGINQLVRQSPHGIPAPSMAPEQSLTSTYPNTKKIIGSWELYSKQIAMDSLFPYPLVFRSTLQYFDSGMQGSLRSKAAIFLVREAAAIEALQYSPNLIEARIKANADDTIVLKQNNYKNWSATIDDRPTQLETRYGTLISIPIAAGPQNVRIEFRNDKIQFLLIAELIAVLLLLIACAWMNLKKDHRMRYIFP